MTTYTKNGVHITMPPMDKTAKLNMERAAEFMARMLQKYGPEIRAEIEAKEAKKGNPKDN